MGVIFDSCVWVALSTGQIDRNTVIKACGDHAVFTSAISIGELSFGVHACQDVALRSTCAAYLRQIESRPILEVTRHTAAAFGLLAATLKQAGRSPRPRYNDLWIASQAIEHGFALLTLNAQDFADLPGLNLIALRGSRI